MEAVQPNTPPHTQEKLESASSLPLSGVIIMELAAIGPVPFAGQILQQLGARLISIQSPQDRNVGLPLLPQHDYLNRGKQSIRIDLKSASGHKELLKLVRDADVLLEGFRPGTLERLGLAPDTLHGCNNSLIIGRCSGWGKISPRKFDAGHDINYLALSGALASIGNETPLPPLNLIGDFGGAAMHLSVGIIAALLQRHRDSRGVVVDTSIYEGTTSLMSMIYGMLDAGQWQATRHANVLDGGAPYYRCYETADNKWVAVGAIEKKFFTLFIDKIKANVDIARQNDRSYWPTMQSEIAACIKKCTRDEWSRQFANTDACCTPVLTLDEARHHADTAGFFTNGAPKPAITFTA